MGRGIFAGAIARLLLLVVGLVIWLPNSSFGADTLCARVKIEIKQELTLERQAFDAHMRINNGLAHITLEDVAVEVSFKDGDGNTVLASTDPDNTDALFFIRLDSRENIDDVSGYGSVAPATTADIHWLIIPAPGASNGLEKGTLYYVGAKLTYTIGGEKKVTEVTPDYIFVKPMPEITLDYFLPSEVYGDDAFTTEIEPPVPFSLGVRVQNNGHGVARNLKIDSAQPKITENEQGLLIGFAIEGSEVNGQPATDSLLADFGDIDPGTASVARWIMTCTLSGEFVAFNAAFSHADELGGELTSLITAANTHFLVRDVLVDLPGRDNIRDFLAKDGQVLRVYETDSTDTEVVDASAASTAQTAAETITLNTPVTAGFMYVQIPDPFGGDKVIKQALRSDGKVIKPANAWLSKTRNKEDMSWEHFVNLFDANSTSQYSLQFESAGSLPQPPVLQFIDDVDAAEGESIGFMVHASDPDNTIPNLTASPLPAGASFLDEGDGLGAFAWIPAEGQAGVYEIMFKASDGVLESTRRATITIKGFTDADGDEIDDEWETKHFGNLDRDGSGDFDHDGISDLDEFLNETDPAGLADIAVQLTADEMNPEVGDALTISIVVTNRGLRDVTGVQLIDLLSSGLSHVSDDSGGSYVPASGIWDVGDLSAEEGNNSAVLNIAVTVARPGRIVNIASLTDADLYDPVASNNSAGVIINGGPQADLAIVQTSDNPVPDAGDTIVLSLKVSNNGIDTATGVQVTDILPDGLNYEKSDASQGTYESIDGIWVVGDLNPGDSAQLELTVIVADMAETINTAVISHIEQQDPDPTNNRCSVIINRDPENHPYVADLAVYKLANQEEVQVGETAEYTLVIRNIGPDDAGDVEIDDSLPQGMAYLSSQISHGTYDDESGLWDVGTLPAGSYAIMDTRVEITDSGEQINAAAVGSLTEFDPDSGNDSATGLIKGLAADIGVIKGVDKTIATVGDNIVYTIIAGNNGPSDAAGIQITDILSSDLSHQSSQVTQGNYDPDTGLWDVGDLENGAQATLTITARVESAAEITNRVEVTASLPVNLNPANDFAEITIIGNVPPTFVKAIEDKTIDEGDGFETIALDEFVSDGNNSDEEIAWSHSGSSQLEIIIDDDRVAAIEIPHENWNGSETITFTATDPYGLSADSTATFTVVAVNDPPVIDGPASLITDEDNDISVDPPVMVSDPDAFDAEVAIEISATNGTLTLGALADLIFTSGDGTADEMMTFTGTIAALNKALTGMRFDPLPDYAGNADISVRIDDRGNSGTGGPRTDVDTIAVTINAVNDPPVAEIAPAFSGDEGREIAFTGSAADIDSSVLTYSWDFDFDGTFAADAVGVDLTAVGWTYPDNGTYTVALKVEDDAGAASQTVFAQVEVADLGPAAAFDWIPAMPAEGIPVAFTDLSVSSPDQITAFSWSFGEDGQTSDEADPQFAFRDNGSYTVSLKVTDDDGSTDTIEHVVTVANVNPDVDAGKDQTVNEGQAVSFAGSFSDPGADTHQIHWEFGDGASASGMLDPVHTYVNNGTYQVTLTVTDDDGGVGQDSLTMVVVNAPPVVSAGPGQDVNEGDTVYFSGSYTDAGLADTHTMTWDFGDGTPVVTGTLTPTHVYADNGSYTAILKVIDNDGGVGTGTMSVIVKNSVPVVLPGDNQSAAEGMAVHFTAGFTDPGADTHTIEWNFGDGSSASGTLTPVHSYGDDGTYTVTVTVTDDDGGVGTGTLSASVLNVAPAITQLTSNSPSSGEIQLSAAFTDPGWLDSHSSRCDFGDGEIADMDVAEENEKPDATGTMNAVHQYAAEGLYTFGMTVTDDDGAEVSDTIEILIDKTPPVITVFEPQAGYYYNTFKISVDLNVEDPESGGVSSGLVPDSMVVTLDGLIIAQDEILDLSVLSAGSHTLHVAAADYAGNTAEHEIVFEVGPVPVMTDVKPQRWNLSWLNPFDSDSGTAVTAYISFENVETEAILPTSAVSKLKVGRAYGDFVVTEVVAAPETAQHGPERIRSVTLVYSGIEQIDVLAFSGDKTWDEYGLNHGDSLLLDAGEDRHLGRNTVIAYYQTEPPLFSAADILPETVRLNGSVPILPGSAKLITKDPAAMGQSLVSAEPPITVIAEGRHHVWLSDLVHPQSISLEVGNRVIFENESYPLKWHDRFSLEEDGAMQTMGIFASPGSDSLRVFYHNLQAEARILLDGIPAVTILPETKLVTLKVQFDRFEAISSLDDAALERGGDWEVTTHGGVRQVKSFLNKHVLITDLGNPQTARFVVGDTVVFENKPFPINWRDRHFIVDGERQDMSIYTFGYWHQSMLISIHSRKLTRQAELYLDDQLVLQISPPPDATVTLIGSLEFDGNPETFDGSFEGEEIVMLKGRVPQDIDLAMSYQPINTSGEPALQVGDRFGDFEIAGLQEDYKDWRTTILEFVYEGLYEVEVGAYEDWGRKRLIGSYQVYPGDRFALDVSHLDKQHVYLAIGKEHSVINLTGKKAAEIDDSFLDCTVIDLTRIPIGPPDYIALDLEYTGGAEAISLTAFDGRREDVIGVYEVDPTFDALFTVDGSVLPKGHMGENLVLEYGPVETSE